MTEYSVTIAGKQYFPYNVFFSKNVDFRTPGDFELIFPHVESNIQLDDTVDINRDGTTIFRGKVETLETYKTGEDLQFHVTGRDMSVALLRLTTGRDLFQSKDPSEICETLNSPGKLIQLQSQKFIAYPEMDTYVDSYWNSGYPTYIWMYTRRYLVFPQHQRALIKFDLTNILGKIDSVTNATLYLHVIGTDNRYGNGQPDTDPKPKSYYRILGPWDESVKWTTQPSFSSTATGTTYHTHGEADIWVSVDLTSDVQAWKSGTANYGWLIRDPNEDVPCDGCSHQTRFHTSESPYTPYLVITASYNNGIVAVASASLNNSDAYKIIDQNASTYWNSGQAQASGQWVKVDLGKTYELRRIIIQMGIPNYAKNFKIEVSTNDTDYTQIYSKTNNDASTVDITITPTNARYVKVTLTGSASDQWDIYEMYFYESSLPALEIGEIQEFGKVMDFRVDYESRLDAIARLAESIGWEAWIGLDDKLYFGPQMGTNKASNIIFRENLDLFSTRKQVSMLHQARSVTVLGHGEGADQLRVTKTTGSAIPERVVEVKNLISTDALGYVANFLLDQFKDPTETWEAAVKDHYETLAWGCGDTIRIIDEDGESHDLRVLREDRNFNQEEGETVKIILGNKLVCLPNILQEMLENIDIWAKVDQSVYAREGSE